MILDPAQQEAQQQFDEVAQQLLQQSGWLSTFKKPILGLYVWGHVGRGKTMLMDRFFEALPFPEKKRLHFHVFMRWLQNALQERDGMPNPLEDVMQEFAQKTRVLCFDEFLVTDIGDAMLFVGVLKALFKRRITLVLTSNVPPEDLYKNGLQRTQFLPAIELLKTQMRVCHLDNGIDYRLRALQRCPMYWYPLGPEADQGLWALFSDLAQKQTKGGSLSINGREIQTVYQAEGVVWFEFSELCETYRSAQDYLEIVHLYPIILVSNLTSLTSNETAKRFIDLIDVFYDAQVTLLISAATDIDGLYTGERWAFEFARTRSRLWEMQSTLYLSKGK